METRVQFPIDDDPNVFAQRCNDCSARGYLYDVGAVDQAEIERFQPYHRIIEQTTLVGEWVHPLALLRNLSNIHKHRNLTTILFLPWNVSFPQWIKPGGVEYVDFLLFTQMPQSNVFEVGTEAMRALLGPQIEPHVEMAGYCTPTIAFDENRPVVPALDHIAPYVVRILRKFDPVP